MVGDEVVEAVKFSAVSQKETVDAGVLPPVDVTMLHFPITPDGQNAFPNEFLVLPDKKGDIRCPHLSAVLCQQPLSNVPPTAPCSQPAMEPFPWEMQLYVQAHLLLHSSSPPDISPCCPDQYNIEWVPCTSDGVLNHLAIHLLLICHHLSPVSGESHLGKQSL